MFDFIQHLCCFSDDAAGQILSDDLMLSRDVVDLLDHVQEPLVIGKSEQNNRSKLERSKGRGYVK